MNLAPGAFALLALAALVGILAQWSGSLLAELWWRAAVALVAIGLAYELYVTRGLAVAARWLRSEALYLGRHERLSLEVKNETGRDLTIEVSPQWPEGLAGESAVRTLRLPPSAAGSTWLEARAVALGQHSSPTLPARIKGPLKLAWWSRRVPLAGTLRVLPDTLGRRAALAGTREGATAQTTIGGGLELHHLRAYEPGDPQHAIDWKATARSSRLITRVFSEDQHLEVMVLLDAGRTSRTQIDGMSQFGHYANLAARFAEHCVANDDQVGLIVFADRPLVTLKPARGMQAVTRIRRALAEQTSRTAESDVLAAALHVRRLVRHRCLVLVLADLYERTATSQLAQSARLLVPKHLPMIVGLMSGDVLELASSQARDWLDPYRSLAAREYQRQVRANVARLTQLGAHALTARARELDGKVFDTYRELRAQRRI